MYNYLDVVTNDVVSYIQEEIDADQYASRERLEEVLNDTLWEDDSVTGNSSGSYTMNAFKARSFVLDNLNLLSEACSELGIENEEIGQKFLQGSWEWMDVVIRCYVLPQAIHAALDKLEYRQIQCP